MTPWLDDGDVRLYHGDALDVLRGLPDGSVDCVVTSPPYWGLRDYGTGEWDGGDPDCDHLQNNPTSSSTTLNAKKEDAFSQNVRTPFRSTCGKCAARRVDQQIGLEETPDEYVTNMVAVFREVRRVLADHGTCWVNLGDSYNSRLDGSHGGWNGSSPEPRIVDGRGPTNRWAGQMHGLAQKNLMGMPWRVAFGLQADGWILRSDIIWAKPNPMPESVTDRPTKSHEYVFLLTKRPRYWFDTEAVREPSTSPEQEAHNQRYAKVYDAHSENVANGAKQPGNVGSVGIHSRPGPGGRNVRSVWNIATQPYPEAHFATFPEELARRCILAGCPVRACRVCGKPEGAEVIRTPLGNGPTVDPTPLTGRKGMNRERRPDEGTRPITKAEQQDYARQLRESPHRAEMEREAGPAFAHYVRTDESGARPVPPDLLAAWQQRGWLTASAASDCGHNTWRLGTVLDPFIGSGTVAKVARDHQRHAVGIDLNEQYLRLAARRLQQLSLLAN